MTAGAARTNEALRQIAWALRASIPDRARVTLATSAGSAVFLDERRRIGTLGCQGGATDAAPPLP
jgi:hypothetical protein